MSAVLNVSQTKQMLLLCAERIIAAKPLLTEIDSRIGDGDHGMGMEVGMNAATAALAALSNPADINTLFRTVGMSMMQTMGGASGVIFGTMFFGAVSGMQPFSALNGQILAELLEQSVAAVQARGKAQTGDKTMVDALYPAAQAAKQHAPEGLPAVLCAAVQAAEQGVEATKGYVAAFGRAKSLGERALGFQDSGATSVKIILQAMRDYVQEGNAEL